MTTLVIGVYEETRAAISHGVAAGLPAPQIITACGDLVTAAMARYEDLHAWLCSGIVAHQVWLPYAGVLGCEVTGRGGWTAVMTAPFPPVGDHGA